MPDSSQAIVWRLHLASAPKDVYRMLATNEGRARFWAESAVETEGRIEFVFPNGLECESDVLAAVPPSRYVVRYFGGSLASFELEPDGRGGTDLTLTDEGVSEADWAETYAGWLSVLLSLKAALDFGVDLRNHDQARTWDQGFVDN